MSCGIFPSFRGNTELHIAEGGKTVIDECEMIVITFFGPNYLINGSMKYFFCLKGTVKKMLKYRGRRETRKFGNSWTILWARQLKN